MGQRLLKLKKLKSLRLKTFKLIWMAATTCYPKAARIIDIVTAMFSTENIILRTDSYKFTHWKQYAMQQAGFSADNIAFGSGGGLLQKLNRDTLQFAFKCAAITVNGVERNVFKNPVTDHGKRSKSGRMKLVKIDGAGGASYQTVKPEQPGDDQLVEVFRDGKILRQWLFSEVRQRAKTWI